MVDKRIEKLADVLVNYSVSLKKGEKILIEAKGIDYMLVNAIVKEVYKAGGLPFVELFDNRITRELLMGQSEELAKLRAKYDGARMAEMDAYIGIRGGDNSFELSDVPADKMQAESEFYSHPVHHELRVKKTKWVILRYPNPAWRSSVPLRRTRLKSSISTCATSIIPKWTRRWIRSKRLWTGPIKCASLRRTPTFRSPSRASARSSARGI